MPPPYGVTETGFNAKTEAEVNADLIGRARASAVFGANLNYEPESALGQLLRNVGAAIGEVWQAADGIYRGGSVLDATGASLDRIASATLVAGRRAATRSTVTVTLAGAAGTVVPEGTVIVLTDAEARFTVAEATIGGGGTVTALATAENTGPIPVEAASTWTIATPVTGLTGVTNGADGTLGLDGETDPSLRARALASRPGIQAVNGALVGAIFDAGATEVVVVENWTAQPDADGRPPHSFEVVARGGTASAIAQAAQSNKPPGIQLVSTVGGSFQESASVIDGNGDTVTAVFSRPEARSVWLEVDYTPRSSFPSNGETLIRQAVLDFDAALAIGQGVSPADVQQAILCAFAGPVFALLEIRMGLNASPPTAETVPTSKTQLADFDTARITIARI